jgi:hypothetical protein
MHKYMSLILVLPLAACGVCKSSDSPELCRTKQRDHSQPRTDLAGALHETIQQVSVAGRPRP